MLFDPRLTQLCVLYAITPLHAGSGQAIGAVDLPIQRERHTRWPMVQASGVKGAFRDWFQRYYLSNGPTVPEKEKQCEQVTERVFGQAEEGEGKKGQAGAVAFTDARILAFPVRSQVAPFVWVTCPAVLARLRRDLALGEFSLEIPDLAPQGQDGFLCVAGNINTPVVLEDLAVSPETGPSPEAIKELKKTFATLTGGQVTRLLLISDANFKFLVENATEIQPQIAIDFDTGATKEGSLRYQELLPSDSVLYCLVFYAPERIKGNNGLDPRVIRNCLTAAISSHLQLGGDLTLGRGLMEVHWHPPKEGSHA
ncbi:MAG: type III-B CRISPR module RAMP protein Cmr4 [Syntrophobacterales bacterium]|nr:type III-B CRISPR module RAMP protein Cmr4 [Syntrophobacterales bacterium]